MDKKSDVSNFISASVGGHPGSIYSANQAGVAEAFASMDTALGMSTHGFKAKHIAESLARIEAGTHVLTARVTVNDETMVVLASEITKAFEALHGTPMPYTKFDAKIVYVAMPSEDFAKLAEYQ